MLRAATPLTPETRRAAPRLHVSDSDLSRLFARRIGDQELFLLSDRIATDIEHNPARATEREVRLLAARVIPTILEKSQQEILRTYVKQRCEAFQAGQDPCTVEGGHAADCPCAATEGYTETYLSDTGIPRRFAARDAEKLPSHHTPKWRRRSTVEASDLLCLRICAALLLALIAWAVWP